MSTFLLFLTAGLFVSDARRPVIATTSAAAPASINPWPAARDEYIQAYGLSAVGGEQEPPAAPTSLLAEPRASFLAAPEPKATPMADFLKGAWNAALAGASKVPGQGPLALLNAELTFTLDAEGLGPFAGLLTSALGLTSESPSPMQPILDKLVELQKDIDTIAGNLDQV